MRILIIGFGAMGQALVKGWNDAYELTVIDPFKEGCAKLEHLPSDYYPDVIIIAVKPQILEEVLPAYTKFKHSLFISIVAGIPMHQFTKWLSDETRLARVMPNLPVIVKEGTCAYMLNDNCTESDREIVEVLLKKIGIFEELQDEKLFDAVTALSGSGPAYVYYLCECLEIAGKEFGLTSDFAEKFARQTIIGAAATLKKLPEDNASTLRKNVTSKGGTTEAALKILMKNKNFQTLFSTALTAAHKRSQELAK